MEQVPILGAFDKATAIAAAVIVSFVGNGVFIGLPVIIGALADSLGFDEEQLGYIASAETGGLLVAALFTSALITKVSRKKLAVTGILVAAAANMASMFVSEFDSLFALRVVSGLGGGICYSLGVGCLAGTHHTARNFSILIFGLVFMNAVELYSFPTISEYYGVAGIYGGFACVFALSLLVVPWIPSYAETPTTQAASLDKVSNKKRLPRYMPIMCLVAVFFFYITISSFWTYIERAGVNAGFSDDFITNTLTIGTLFSLIGCVTAAWLSDKFGQSKPLIIALICMALTMALLAAGITEMKFLLGLFAFNVLWNFADIYQLGTIGNIDHSGRFAALVPAAQHSANTFGPTMAATMFTVGWNFTGVMLLAALGSALALLTYLLVYARLKKFAPQLADAS